MLKFEGNIWQAARGALFAIEKRDFNGVRHSQGWNSHLRRRMDTVVFSISAVRVETVFDNHQNNIGRELSCGKLNATFSPEAESFSREQIFDSLVKDGKNTTLPAISTRFYATAIISPFKVWVIGGTGLDDDIRHTLKLYDNLPHVPEGYDGWFSLNNKQAGK